MSFGITSVDWGSRIDYDRLRKQRVERAKSELKKSDLGAVLCFDFYNIRYLTSTFIGMWGRSPDILRYSILPKGGEPLMFERGSARLKVIKDNPWLSGRIFPAKTGWRSVEGDEIYDKFAQEVKKTMKDHGVADLPLGVDFLTVPLMHSFERNGIKIADGDKVMFDARIIKTTDEIECERVIASMVDAAYDKIAKAIAPGVRENELVAIANYELFKMGADDVESINCMSGPRTNPNHHDFSDRMIRPGDLVFLDIMASFNGYRSCYYRTFCCGRANAEQKRIYQDAYDWIEASIRSTRPGTSTSEIASQWPEPMAAWGTETAEDAPGNNIGHGLGLGLHEPPFISRTYSLSHPQKIEKNMVLALETYSGKKGGKDGVRLEEMVLVTESGHEVLSKYPLEEIPECV